MSIKDLTTKVTNDDVSMARESLRLDEGTDEALLRMYIKAARNDIIRQVGERIDNFFDDNEVFNTAVLIEVGHLYNHRQTTSTQEEYEVPMALYSLINSLKDEYRYQVYISDDLDDPKNTESTSQGSVDKQPVGSDQSKPESGEQNDETH